MPVRMAATVKQLIGLARRADVIFANGLYLEAAIAAAFVGRPLVIKIVGDEVWERASHRGWTKAEMDDFQTAPSGWKIRLFRRLRRYTISSSKAVIVPSQYTAGLVRRWAPGLTPIHVIPNAVGNPLTSLDFHPRSESQARRTVAFVGRLIPLKRVDGLLTAIAAIEGVGLVIVGDGPDREALERLALALGLEHRVQFTGAIDQDKVAAILAECFALVLNSTTENCPHVVLEAMAMGLPVIATRVGGIPELVEDGVSGLLIDPIGEGQLHAAIKRLLDDERLRMLLTTGALETSRRFSWSANAEAVANVLEGVTK